MLFTPHHGEVGFSVSCWILSILFQNSVDPSVSTRELQLLDPQRKVALTSYKLAFVVGQHETVSTMLNLQKQLTQI